jgi:F-type H+-transporting ATPase subunit b
MGKILLLTVGTFLMVCWIASFSVSAQHPVSEPEAKHATAQEHASESPWTLVFKWTNFLVLFGGLGWLLRKPFHQFLESRSQGIAEGLARAEEAKKEAQQKLAEIEARLSNLDHEIKAIKEQALQQAEEERVHILEGARQEAKKILEMGRNEIEALRKSARLELKSQVAALAVKLAEERLQSAIGPEENKKIIDRFLERLDASKN